MRINSHCGQLPQQEVEIASSTFAKAFEQFSAIRVTLYELNQHALLLPYISKVSALDHTFR